MVQNTPYWDSGPNLAKFGPPDEHFSGQNVRFGTIWGLKTACFAHEMATRGAPNVRNWVSDTDLVNIGQLDHYVVIGTKFGAVQYFQSGKLCPLGVQTSRPLLAHLSPLDPPEPPPNPTNLLSDPP